MKRELTPEEEKEYLCLIKKSLHTVLIMSKKDWERLESCGKKSVGLLRNRRKRSKKIVRISINSKKV